MHTHTLFAGKAHVRAFYTWGDWRAATDSVKAQFYSGPALKKVKAETHV